jgi:hypothetical protein
MARPRFTLRVALVVTAIVAIVAWRQTNWIRQRRAEIKAGALTPMFQGSGVTAPELLGLFGEPGYFSLRLRDRATAEEMERLQSLFPEAQLHQPLRQ